MACRMGRMRTFTSDYRLQGFSTREIAESWEDAATRVGRRFKFDGRKVKPGPLLNALVLWYLGLDEAARLRLAGHALANLEVFLAETDDERRAAMARLTGARHGPAAGAGDVPLGVEIDTGMFAEPGRTPPEVKAAEKKKPGGKPGASSKKPGARKKLG
jgi:hypothetical protein